LELEPLVGPIYSEIHCFRFQYYKNSEAQEPSHRVFGGFDVDFILALGGKVEELFKPQFLPDNDVHMDVLEPGSRTRTNIIIYQVLRKPLQFPFLDQRRILYEGIENLTFCDNIDPLFHLDLDSLIFQIAANNLRSLFFETCPFCHACEVVAHALILAV
jgi:hypothetical protein